MNLWAMFSNIIHSFPFHLIICSLNHCSLNLNFMYKTIQLANELIEYFKASWIFVHCLSVIYAIYEYLLSHLFNSVVVALVDSCVVYFTWAIPKFIHALIKHKDYINISCLANSHQTILILPLKLSKSISCNPLLFCHIFLIITSQ
jgi:hypothetical protein